MSKYHYVYKTTIIKTNQYYIGVRSSDVEPELDTDYLGSGTIIRAFVKKLPRCEFNKEILGIFETRAEANIVEREFILEEDRSNPFNLNIFYLPKGRKAKSPTDTYNTSPHRYVREYYGYYSVYLHLHGLRQTLHYFDLGLAIDYVEGYISGKYTADVLINASVTVDRKKYKRKKVSTAMSNNDKIKIKHMRKIAKANPEAYPTQVVAALTTFTGSRSKEIVSLPWFTNYNSRGNLK